MDRPKRGNKDTTELVSIINNESNMKNMRLSSINKPIRGNQVMLMIPQPALKSVGVNTAMRFTHLESNAYVALGIKEEPEDVIELLESTSHIETEFNSTSEESTPKDATEGDANNNIRRTRSMKNKEKQLFTLLKTPTSSTPPISTRLNAKLGVLDQTPVQSASGAVDNPSENNVAEVFYGVAHLTTSQCCTPAEGDTNNNTRRTRSSEKREKQLQSASILQIPVVSMHPSLAESNENLGGLDQCSVSSTSSAIKYPLPDKPLISTEGINIKTEQEDEPERIEEDGEEKIEELVQGNFSEPDESSSSSDETEDIFGTAKMWALLDEERKTLTCSVCKKKCSRPSILTAHKKKHFDPNVYKCDHCDKIFSSESSYKHHIAYSGLAPFKCDKCGKSYYTEQKCATHREQCTGKSTERKYNCEECGRSYMMLCSLRTHIREHHSNFVPVKNLCCEHCGKRFRHRKYLDLHMYSHSSEKNFKCDECGRYYKSSDILRHHVRMVHKNLPKVTCDLCGKEVSRVSLKAHMNRHRERQEEEEESARHLLQLAKADDESAPRCRVCRSFVHNEKQLEMHHCAGRFDDSLFPCPDCTKSFKAASDLVRHTCSSGRDNSKSRNSSKVYKCIFCGREYNCHTPYLYHVRHHTGEKPYPCTECDKSFRLKQGLKVHMRNHTGEKPFKCDQCPAAFKQKPFLLDHLNTHTGEKPYQCEQCLKRFSVRSALSTHKRIHRRKPKEQH